MDSEETVIEGSETCHRFMSVVDVGLANWRSWLSFKFRPSRDTDDVT